MSLRRGLLLSASDFDFEISQVVCGTLPLTGTRPAAASLSAERWRRVSEFFSNYIGPQVGIVLACDLPLGPPGRQVAAAQTPLGLLSCRPKRFLVSKLTRREFVFEM